MSADSRSVGIKERGWCDVGRLQEEFTAYGVADCVLNFRKWFRSSVDRPKSMEAAATIRCHNRAMSIRSVRRAFSSSESIWQQS